jgi:hypothetical protein
VFIIGKIFLRNLKTLEKGYSAMSIAYSWEAAEGFPLKF